MANTLEPRAFTSQQLGFARIQLTHLKDATAVFQLKAYKQALILQSAIAMKAYLYELGLLTAFETSQHSLSQSLKLALTRLRAHDFTDFRGAEIKTLLEETAGAKGWLTMLAGMEQSCHLDPAQASENKKTPIQKKGIIIAVKSGDTEAGENQSNWWECTSEKLEELIINMESMIQRHRDQSFEE